MNLFKKTSSHWVRYVSYELIIDDKAGHNAVNPVFLFPLYFAYKNAAGFCPLSLSSPYPNVPLTVSVWLEACQLFITHIQAPGLFSPLQPPSSHFLLRASL